MIISTLEDVRRAHRRANSRLTTRGGGEKKFFFLRVAPHVLPIAIVVVP